MSEQPRVDKVSGQFFRKGKCEVCGKQTERLRTFTGSSFSEMEAKGAAWTEPLRHRKCEWLSIPEATS